MSAATMEIKIPAGASEVTLKTAGKYCDKDIRVNTHFRIEHGTVRGGSEYITDYVNNSGVVKGKTITIPCSKNPKLIMFKATQATQEKLVSLLQDGTYAVGTNPTYALIFNNIIDFDEASNNESNGRNVANFQFSRISEENTKVYPACTDAVLSDVDTLPKTNVGTLYNGDDAEYEWTAYYWDE